MQNRGAGWHELCSSTTNTDIEWKKKLELRGTPERTSDYERRSMCRACVCVQLKVEDPTHSLTQFPSYRNYKLYLVFAKDRLESPLRYGEKHAGVDENDKRRTLSYRTLQTHGLH
jgi:hypothetical protein